MAGLATVAFAVYAATMPSFFLSWPSDHRFLAQWAAVLAILVALFLPIVAKRLQVRR